MVVLGDAQPGEYDKNSLLQGLTGLATPSEPENLVRHLVEFISYPQPLDGQQGHGIRASFRTSTQATEEHRRELKCFQCQLEASQPTPAQFHKIFTQVRSSPSLV